MNTNSIENLSARHEHSDNAHNVHLNSRESQLKISNSSKHELLKKGEGEVSSRMERFSFNKKGSQASESLKRKNNEESSEKGANKVGSLKEMQMMEIYNSQKSPPDIEMAKKHGKAKRIAKETKKREIKISDYCMCCGYAIENELLPLTCRRDDLAFTGPGLPLYLEFVYYCVINLFLVFFISGIYNTYIIMDSHSCHELTSEQKKKYIEAQEYSCEKSFFLMISMGNTFYDSVAVERQGWTCLATVIFWILFIHVIRYQIEKLRKKCDEKLTSPSDYTFCLEGLPVGSFEREDINDLVQNIWKNLLKRLGSWNPPANIRTLQVKKIVFAYSIGKYVKKIRRKNILEARRRNIIKTFSTFKRKATVNFERSMTRKSPKRDERNVKPCTTQKPKNEEEESENTEEMLYLSSQNSPVPRPSGLNSTSTGPFKKKLDLLDSEILKLINEIQLLEEHITEDRNKSLCRMVFVSVGEQIQSSLIVKTYNLSLYKKIETRVRNFFNMAVRNDVCIYKGKLINIRRAPEPNDILWENLDVTKSTKLKIRFKINLITFGTLILGFSFLLGFRLLQSKLEENSLSDISENEYFQKSFRMMTSILIVFINFILRSLIQYLVNHEKHKTITAYKANVATRIIISEFSNTALHIILAQLYLDRYSIWHENNLVTSVFFLFWTNIWVPAIFTCFDPEKFYYKYKRKLISKNKHNSRFSQGDAHKYFEGIPLDMSEKYAQVMKCMFFTAFYASLLPLGVLIATVGLIITYWVDKYAFLRIYSRPVSLGPHLNFEMLKMLDITPFLYSSGQLFFSYLLSPKFDISYLYGAGMGLFISACNTFVPWGTLYEMVWAYRNTNKEFTDTESYDDCFKSFSNDYDRTNPVTQHKAVNDWISNIKQTNYYNKAKNLGNYLNFVYHEHSSQRKVFQRYAEKKISQKLLVNSNNVYQDTMMKKLTATANMFRGSMIVMKSAKAFKKTIRQNAQLKVNEEAAVAEVSEITRKSELISRGDLTIVNESEVIKETERPDKDLVPDSIDGVHRLEMLQVELSSNAVKSKFDLDLKAINNKSELHFKETRPSKAFEISSIDS